MLVVELENTKADNVKLYGKIRYVQDYNLEKLSSRGPKKVLTHFSFLYVHQYLVATFHFVMFFFSMQKTLKPVILMLSPSIRKCMRMI